MNQIFSVDSTTKDPKKTGFYKKNEKIAQSEAITTSTKINDERQYSIRVQDSTIDLPGIMRFNEVKSRFQGFVGGSEGDNNDGWVSFNTYVGQNGTNGKDSITDITGVNNSVSGESNIFGVFKDLVKVTDTVTTVVTTQINNLEENIFSSPAYTYSSFSYVDSSYFDLSEKTVLFVPYNSTSYKTYVRNNESWPKVPYYSHDTIRTLNKVKISADSYYAYYLSGNRFKFYNEEYTIIYIHENGYINFTKGDNSYFSNTYVNHLDNYRISAFMANLINNSDNNEINQADIYIGTGKYGEVVITYNNFSYNDTSTTTNNYNNFQIRLWMNESTIHTDSTLSYSDDYYPKGTIEISYGKTQYTTPLVGLGNKTIYNELTYSPLSFSTLLDFSWDETKGLGVSDLKAILVLTVSNTTSQGTLLSSSFNTNNQLVKSDNKFRINVLNTDWTTTYSEKSGSIIYYSKILDLGDLTVDSLLLCIKGEHDYAITDSENSNEPNSTTIATDKTEPSKKFSDSTNALFDKDSLYKNIYTYIDGETELNSNNWKTIAESKYVSMADLYSETGSGTYATINKQKDYHNLYQTSTVNSGIYNSSIYRIQAKYTDYNLNGTLTNNDTTKLYNGSSGKKLLLKVIYTLKSDVDTPTTHTYGSATALDGTVTTDGITFPSTTVGGYHYIPGNDDYYKVVINNTKKVKIELYDYLKEASSTRKNYSLKIAIYKETTSGITVTRTLYKDFTTISSTYDYPSQTIDNTVFGTATGDDITYYIIVSGSIKAYYYGIKLSLQTADTSTEDVNQVLQFSMSDITYDDMSTSNITALKTEITDTLIEAADDTTGLTLTSSNLSIITISAGSGGSGTVATVYFTTAIDETESTDLKDTLNGGSYTITVPVGSTESTKTISSVESSSISSESVPSTGEEEEDSGGGGGGSGDITGPRVTGISITSNPAGGSTYFNNEVITLGVVVDEATVVDISGGTPYLNLIVGSNTREAGYTSISEDGLTLTFSYTVASDDVDANGVSINANPINLNSGTIKDAAGNDATLTFSSITDNESHKVANSNIYLEKSGFLSGNIHDVDRNESSTLDILAYSYVRISDVNYYCFLSLDLNKTTKTLKLNVVMPSGTVASTDIATILFQGSSEQVIAENLPFYLTNQSNKLIIFYGNGNASNANYRILTIEKYTITISSSTSVEFSKTDLTTITASDASSSHNGVINNNTGIIDSSENIYFYEISSSNILIKKIDTSGTITTFKTITGSGISATTSYAKLFFSNGIIHFVYYDSVALSYKDYYYSLVESDEIPIIYNNPKSFILRKYDGNLLAWGGRNSGGNFEQYNLDSHTYTDISSSMKDIVKVVGTKSGTGTYAAIKKDGSVLVWGEYSSAEPLTTIPSDAVNVKNIFATDSAFAALKSDSSVVTWGSSIMGGDSSSVTLTNISTIYSNSRAFAAVNSSGELITWGDSYGGGNASSTIKSFVENKISKIVSTGTAFAALLTDNTVVAWGSAMEGGTITNYHLETYSLQGNHSSNYSTETLNHLTGITDVVATNSAFAALTSSGGVITWGSAENGRDQKYINPSTSTETFIDSSIESGVESIFSNYGSFAALNTSDNLIVWGNNNNGGAPYEQLSEGEILWDGVTLEDISTILGSTDYGYLAKKTDNTLITWGSYNNIKNYSSVSTSLSGTNISTVNTNKYAYSVIKTDNTLVTWGDSSYGGDSSSISSIDYNPTTYDITSDNLQNKDFVNGYTKNNIECLELSYYTSTIDSSITYTNLYLLEKSGSNYNVYIKNISQQFQITSIPSSTHFYDFQIFKSLSSTYLLIMYLDTTKKLLVYKIEYDSDTYTHKSFSSHPDNVQFAYIKNDELRVFQYNTSTGLITVSLYDLTESTLTASSTTYTRYLNKDNVIGLFSNYLLDNNSRPYFITQPSALTGTFNDDSTKYGYDLYLYNVDDSGVLAKSFSISNEIKIEVEEQINIIVDVDDDEIEIENILDLDTTLDKLFFEKEIMLINNVSYNVYLYIEDNELQLRVFNDTNFSFKTISINENDITNIGLYTNNNEIFIYYTELNSVTIDKFVFLNSDIVDKNLNIKLYNTTGYINILFNNTDDNINDNNIDNNAYLIYIDKEYEELIINKILQDDSLILLKEIELENITLSNNVIKGFIENNNLMLFMEDNNFYYKYNINTELFNNYYSVHDILKINDSLSIKFINNDIYSVGSLLFNNLYSINLYKNNNVLVSITEFNELFDLLNEFKIYQFEIYNDKEIIISYTDKLNSLGIGNNTKNIIYYNLETDYTIRNSLKFNQLGIIKNNILLFDTRNINKQIFVKYLGIDNNEIINTNIFRNDNYNYLYFDNIELINDNNNIELLGYINNLDDDSLLIDKIIYTDNSEGIKQTYVSDIELLDNEEINNFQIISGGVNSSVYNISNEQIGGTIARAITYETLESNKNVNVVESGGSNYFVFNSGTSYSEKKYYLNTGKYIIKNVPMEHPIAILNNNSSLITYRGLSYNNKNPSDYSSNLVKSVTESSNTYAYYFYYGDILIDVKGDFGTVSYYCYNHGYMGGQNSFVYSSSVTSGSEDENALLLNEISLRKSYFLEYYNYNYSPYVVGRDKDSTYSEDNTGSIFYSSVYPYSTSSDNNNFYIRSNNVPNYEPSYSNTIIKGSWKEETTNSSEETYYAIDKQNYGYLDINNIVNGKAVKIPIEPKQASKNLYYQNNIVSDTNLVNETFWYKDDLYWKTVMTDTSYDSKLLTPMGAIGITVNGILLYNFAVNKNTITISNTYTTESSNNNSYYTDSSVKETLSTTNSDSITNAITDETQIYDSQMGIVDVNNSYHHHTYPITVEGMITMGTASVRDSSNTEVYISDNLVSDNSLELYIGHTYYFNQSKSNNKNLDIRFSITNTANSYNFMNTLQISGMAGIGYNSYIKFTVPRTFTTTDKLFMFTGTDLTYGASYNNSTTGISIKNREVNLKLKVSGEKFLIYDNNDNLYTDTNKLYFELDVKYILTPDSTYLTSDDYVFIFYKNNSEYTTGISLSEVSGTGAQRIITFTFTSLVTSLIVKNNADITDNSGDNYLNLNVYKPKSINYYVDVNTSKFRVFNTPIYRGRYTFNGLLDYEGAEEYLRARVGLTGSSGHSPLLGYAFDGYPIYGPVGYDITDTDNYNSSTDTDRKLKILRSSYTSTTLDTNNNPLYVAGSGDLDYCNGIFTKTPEYPNGVYHYVCTVDTNTDGKTLITSINTRYGYINEKRAIISPTYPYIIGAYKGLPELSNFHWASSSTSTSSSTTYSSNSYKLNFRSLKSIDQNFMGSSNINSILMTQDDNYINLRADMLPYIWNFSNTQEDNYFGKDSKFYSNIVSNLLSTSTLDTEVLKAYGNVSKWIYSGTSDLIRGTAVRIVNKSINGVNSLCVETYNTLGLEENKEKAAFLGIALNNATDGGTCYVCSKGITTVVINNALTNLYCGSYGVLVLATGQKENNGQIVGLSTNDLIQNNTPVAGYFLETKTNVSAGDKILFYVQSNYEFN